MEEIKSFLDVGVAILGVTAAVFAIFSLFYGNRLDAIKKIEEERLKTRVAEANAEAEIAKKEAAKANESIAKTDLKTQGLQLQVQDQREKANNLSLEVEVQKEKALNAEKDLLLLRQKIKPRKISTATITWLSEKIRQHPSRKINIGSSMGDSEASLYARQMSEVFKNAGWDVDDSGISMMIQLNYFGTYIFTRVQPDPDAIFLKGLFKEKDIRLKSTTRDNFEMMLFVGAKSYDVDNHD